MSAKIKIIGKYYFTDKEIQNMKEMLKKTKKFSLEFAARISSSKSRPGELKLTCERLGSATCVEMPNNCGKTRISLGVFHTHTKGTDNMSISDVQSHVRSNHKIECVGGNGKISCYKRKKMKNFRENILSDITIAKNTCASMWMEEGDADLIGQEVSEMSKKLSAELTEKYFNRVRLL
jgi:hypothetical protein